jgi:hypothetical protein
MDADGKVFLDGPKAAVLERLRTSGNAANNGAANNSAANNGHAQGSQA